MRSLKDLFPKSFDYTMDESLLKSSESSSSAKVGKLGYNVGKIVMDSLLTELVDGSGT